MSNSKYGDLIKKARKAENQETKKKRKPEKHSARSNRRVY